MPPKKKLRKEKDTAVDEQYATSEFWDTREKEKIFHEWYYSYHHLKPLIEECITVDSNFRCLEIGCGFAPLIDGLSADTQSGHFLGIDFASNIIKFLNEKPSIPSNITYVCMDARKLTYTDNSIDFCIDKGTIDAMLCANEWEDNVRAIISEMTRVLTPSGSIMIISHMDFYSDEFQTILADVINPILRDRRRCMWSLTVHLVSNLKQEEMKGFATVYVLSSQPRRFTRSLVDADAEPPALQIKLLNYDSSCDEEDGE